MAGNWPMLYGTPASGQAGRGCAASLPCSLSGAVASWVRYGQSASKVGAREQLVMEFVFETEEDTSELESIVEQFIKTLDPVESEALLLFKDECTGAIYTECHIAADTIFKNSTDDVPLDPDASSEYRANRQLVDDHAAYKQMETDALKGR